MQIGCFVWLRGTKEENFSEVTTQEPQCSFEMDVCYSPSPGRGMAMYLLENFAPAPFVVNGRETAVYYLAKKPQKELENRNFVERNKIQLKNIKYTKNEYAFLFVDKDYLFVRRFQVNYPGGEQLPAPQGSRVEAVPARWKPMSKLHVYGCDQKQEHGGYNIPHWAMPLEGFHLYHDMSNDYGKPIFGEYGSKSLTLPITYAAVPVSFGKDGGITTGRIFYYQSSEPQFYIKLEDKIAPAQGEFQLLVFPYPYKYQPDFNRTNRINVWGYVMASNYLQKETQ